MWKWLLLLLSGCTYYGTPVQIPDWPPLKIVVHRVAWEEVRNECQKYAPWWGSARACAVFYQTECHVWAVEGQVGDEDAEIEWDNCAGLARPYWRERMIELRDKINGTQTRQTVVEE